METIVDFVERLVSKIQQVCRGVSAQRFGMDF